MGDLTWYLVVWAAVTGPGLLLGWSLLCPGELTRGTAFRRAAADAFAKSVAPVIHAIQGSGITSLRGLARELVARKVAAARGGHWTPVQVGDLLRRLAA